MTQQLGHIPVCLLMHAQKRPSPRGRERYGGLRYKQAAKASFSAYLLGTVLLKIGEKVHFSTKKSTTNFGRPFCSFPFPFFASKWLKYAVFAFQKAKNVGRKRGFRQTSVGDVRAQETGNMM